MFDYHVHSNVSFDAHSSMEDILESAQQKGISDICFTEHYDLNNPYEDIKQDCDFDLYRANLEKARAAFPGFPVKFGIELGLVLEDLADYEKAAASQPFDFIICSHHVIHGKDPFYQGYFDGRTVREAQREYLQMIYDSIDVFDNFDVVGHIGYMDKYFEKNSIDTAKPENQPFTYSDFPSLFDDILRRIIQKGKGIEVNTSTYGTLSRPMPHPTIIRRYAELGGSILTTGSDSHKAEHIGRFFPEAYRLLLDCGITSVCTFTQRQPTFHKIDI